MPRLDSQVESKAPDQIDNLWLPCRVVVYDGFPISSLAAGRRISRSITLPISQMFEVAKFSQTHTCIPSYSYARQIMYSRASLPLSHFIYSSRLLPQCTYLPSLRVYDDFALVGLSNTAYLQSIRIGYITGSLLRGHTSRQARQLASQTTEMNSLEKVCHPYVSPRRQIRTPFARCRQPSLPTSRSCATLGRFKVCRRGSLPRPIFGVC